MVTCRIYRQLPDEAKRIREQVFIKEQGFENEFDQTDEQAVHIVVFCVCLSVRRSVVVPLLLPVRAFCRSVVAVADARDVFSGRIDASGISFPFGKQR